MNPTARRGLGKTRAVLACAALAWTLAGALVGCAGTAAPDGGRDRITASDEPEALKRARIRMELAVGYFEQGKNDIALDEVKQVIGLDPAFPDAYNLRGLIYMRLNDNRLAEDSFKRAVSLNPRDSNVRHNYGWLLCQSGRFDEAQREFENAVANPAYADRPKTLMTEGLCQVRAGKLQEAEHSLTRSYELDAGNPVTGYNLASLLFRRGDNERARFYIRRLNNGEYANAESLWLGVKVERRMNDMVAMRQLGDQLRSRFPNSREARSFERGAYDE